MRNAPPDAAVARFRETLLDLTGGVPGRLGVAVSGGPDSVALLLLCAAAFPDDTLAATVDHGLRPGGAGEAAFVARLCKPRGVPHDTLMLDGHKGGNVSDWARRERYAALDAWALKNRVSHILTAHHADDQLETVVMRLNRGSGAGGLAAIRARQGHIVRPLLGWRRAELGAICAKAGIEPIQDPSNHDDRFDRARLRKALERADWLDPLAASRSAAALAQSDIALDWAANDWLARRSRETDGVISLDPKELPAELARRCVRKCLAAIDPDLVPRGEELTRLIAGLSAGRIATLGRVLCTGGQFWLFSPAPPRRKN